MSDWSACTVEFTVCHCISGNMSQYLLRAELGQHEAGGTHPQGAQELIHDAVHVMKGEGVQDHIVFAPSPLAHQRLNLTECEDMYYVSYVNKHSLSDPSLLYSYLIFGRMIGW